MTTAPREPAAGCRVGLGATRCLGLHARRTCRDAGVAWGGMRGVRCARERCGSLGEPPVPRAGPPRRAAAACAACAAASLCCCMPLARLALDALFYPASFTLLSWPPRYEGLMLNDVPHNKGVLVFGNGLGGGIQKADRGDRYEGASCCAVVMLRCGHAALWSCCAVL